MEKIESLISDDTLFFVKLILGLACSFLITFYSIPIILKISKRKNLMDEPVVRSSHDRKIPNLGGISIFYALGICAPIFAFQLFDSYKFLFPSLVILLYIGIMDDIVVMRAYKKLIAQIIISVLIVVGSDVRIRSLFGLFGIHQLNYIVSTIFSIITFIIMINAFNLIDGIDGLAGSFAVICCLIFGISYYRLGSYNHPMVILCSIIIGSLIGFLCYNLSDRNEKIFMGDTGSMIIGFLIAFTAIFFVDIFIYDKNINRPLYYLNTAPVIAFSIVIIPMIDTLNVIIVRILNKKSPLEADKNHIHHKLLRLGLTHKKSTFFIILYYIFIIAVTYLLRLLNLNYLFIIILSIGFIGAYIPDLIYRLKIKNKH